MTILPEQIIAAWKEREGAIVLTTVDADSTPNVIYATCVALYQNEKIVVADNYFDKTRQNIERGSKASLLFRTKGGKAYQLKGTIHYHTSGQVFDEMKRWNPAKHPGRAAAVLTVKAIYAGAKKII